MIMHLPYMYYNTGSKDDVGVAEFHWEQLEGGPNVARVEDLVLIGANASGLTKGKYDFRLTVKDALGNEDSDEVTVTVAQDENEAPVADAGRDAEVTLPADSILFNGSRSHDDFRVRFLQSLAKVASKSRNKMFATWERQISPTM